MTMTDDIFGPDPLIAVAAEALDYAKLSPDQRLAYDAVKAFSEVGSNGLLTVGGYAGTGKSTLLGVFAANTKLLVAYITFTGRASAVLGRKLKACGVQMTNKPRYDGSSRDAPNLTPAAQHFDLSLKSRTGGPPFCGTIHRLIYKPFIDPKTGELKGFEKRESLDRDYDLLVVDEASMVSDEMLADLKSYGVPILAVGDHGQLAPVKASGDLMQNPDVRLEKIHRQAEGNPIIQLSRVVRETGRIDRKFADDVRVIFKDRRDVEPVLKSAYAFAASPLEVGVLCWTNKMRIKLNSFARQARSMRCAPHSSELLVCLRNKPPVYNGMRGVVKGDAIPSAMKPWHVSACLDFPEEGVAARDYVLCSAQFNREKVFANLDECKERGMNIFSMKEAGDFYDFGYALTVHKSQGSSFSNAIFYADRPENPGDDDYRRFVYTAVTRASERLTMLM
jgi:exodeoxyribonuclease V